MFPRSIAFSQTLTIETMSLINTSSTPNVGKSIPPWNYLLFAFVYLFVAAMNARAADAWSGAYYDKKQLNGQAWFQMRIEESAGTFHIVFNGGYNNRTGAAPDGQAVAKRTGEGNLEFTFNDSCKNSGSGTIRHAGNDIIVDFIFANGADMKCLALYQRNMHLKRAAKAKK
jgi:hypothetical protein